MDTPEYRTALIVGTGPGLSASLARLFASHGLKVAVDRPGLTAHTNAGYYSEP